MKSQRVKERQIRGALSKAQEAGQHKIAGAAAGAAGKCGQVGNPQNEAADASHSVAAHTGRRSERAAGLAPRPWRGRGRAGATPWQVPEQARDRSNTEPSLWEAHYTSNHCLAAGSSFLSPAFSSFCCPCSSSATASFSSFSNSCARWESQSKQGEGQSNKPPVRLEGLDAAEEGSAPLGSFLRGACRVLDVGEYDGRSAAALCNLPLGVAPASAVLQSQL